MIRARDGSRVLSLRYARSMSSAGLARQFAIELAIPAELACWFSVMALDTHGWLCALCRDLLRDA